LQDVVSKSRNGLLTAIALFGTPLAGVIIDEIENRVSSAPSEEPRRPRHGGVLKAIEPRV
jgi:hypothetical protein